MASRELNDLAPEIAARARQMLSLAEAEGLHVLIYCTLRDNAEQARLFRHGRTLAAIRIKADELRERWGRPDLAALLLSTPPQPGGRIVTNAGPGQSMHNYGLALDGVPMRAGKPVWDSQTPEDATLWAAYGRLGQEAGLEWAGTWTTFCEFPHMQQPGAAWKDLIRVAGV